MELTAEEARKLPEDTWGAEFATYRSMAYAVIREQARYPDRERKVRLPSAPNRHIADLIKQELRHKRYDVSPRGIVRW